jgi:hypothetical protein
LTGPVDSVPLAALVPDQAPEAVQEVAFLLDHVSFEESPTLSELGLAWRVTSGAEALTVTVAVWVAKPPGPLQASSYSVLLVSGPVDHVPLVVTSPCHPPLAVHWSALLALQVNVELPWLPIVVGEATRDTTGAGLVAMTGFSAGVAAAASLIKLNEFRFSPWATSAAVATRLRAHRDKRESRAVPEHSGSQ